MYIESMAFNAEFSLPIPIPQTIRESLTQQIMPYSGLPLDKRTRFLHTLLSTWAVRFYLQTLCQIDTIDRNADRVNPIFALVEDNADLELPEFGCLECRPVAPGDHTCPVPEIAWHDRIGYVIVQIEPDLREAIILGFTPSANNGTIQLSDLQAPEVLLEHLERLKTADIPINENIQNLKAWFNRQFEGAIDQGWETVEAIRQQIQQGLQPAEVYLSNTPEPLTTDPAALSPIIQLLQTNSDPITQHSAVQILGEIGSGSPEATQTLTQFLDTTQNDDLRWQAAISLQKIAPNHPKAAISRSKLINLGVEFDNQKVALIGTLVAEDNITTNLFFQVHSFHRQQALPAGLQLSILDSTKTVLQSATARCDKQGRNIDESIQLLWRYSSHGTFCVRVTIAEARFDEYFAI
jgi:hypothetical protein